MRKFYMFFIALFVSGFASLASAQNYPVNVGTDATNTNTQGRQIASITLQGELGAKQTITVPAGKKVYNDMTSVSGGTFHIKAGQSAIPRFVGEMSWMHSYIFLDYGKDGQFTVTALDNAADDLVSYFHFGADAPRHNALQNFTVPSTPGTYRMRYLIYWNNSADQRIVSPNPAGTSDMGGNGDIVVDVNLEVEALVASILDVDGNALSGATYETAPAYGQDFTFSVPQKYKYSAAVTAKCGVDFSEAQTSETYTWYTYTTLTKATSSTSSFTAKNWQEVTGIVDNGDGTFTIPGAQVKGDLQIQVTYTRNPTFTAAQAAAGECYFLLKNRRYSSRYLKAGITPNSGATDRFTYESPYLFTHTLTQNRSDKDIASYIWRLTPATTNGKYYMKGQGLALGAIANGGNKCVPLQESGAELTIASSGDYYTLTTGAGTNGYLHAIDYGQTRQDGNFPNNAEGDFVVAWSSSETPSQWTIEPIEYFSVTIGAGGWSSFNYAFPIAFAANEVSNVYISTSENTGVVTLVPLTAIDGLISVPSNTPIFVEGVEGTVCTVELLTSEPAAVGANTLRGTTLPQTANLTTGETAYVIATPSEKETALYKLGAGVKIPVNKAYYVSGQSQTSKLELNFGEVTEISNAVTAQPALKDEILYDLRGHRVVYPTRGIYVTGSGRKIFVK